MGLGAEIGVFPLCSQNCLGSGTRLAYV